MATLAAIIGRLCIAALFVLSGIAKLMDPGNTAQYIANSTTLSPALAVPAGIFEIIAGLLLGLGVMTRLVAIILAAFVALVTLLFHSQITDPVQAQNAIKNLAIIGGLLMVFAYGQVSWRVSSWKERDRRHDAEIAAARAEARAELAERHGAAGEPAPARRGWFNRRRTVADRTDGDPRT